MNGQDAGSFTPKRTLMDWDLISRINIDRMLKNEAKLDEELESMYPLLVSAGISEEDPHATNEALVKLFRLSQFVMELKNLFLEGAETQIEKLEDTVQSQQTEISKLKTRMGSTPSAELRLLRQENLDLERRNDLLTRDLQRLDENLAKEVRFGQEVGAALTEEKARYAALAETTRELQSEMKEREVQMVSQRHRLLSKNIEEEEFRSQLKDKNAEINKYLSEIKSLTNQNSHLTAEVDTIGQELEATVSEIERNSTEMEEMQEIINNNDILLEQLTEERDTLKIKVEELHDRVQVTDVRTDELIESLHGEIAYLKKVAADAETNTITFRNQIERQNEELGNLKRSSFSANEDGLRLEIREKDEVIENLRLKLQESYADFQTLSLDWDRIDSLVQGKSGGEIEGLRSQAALAGRMKEKMDLFKQRHVQDTEKMKELEKQVEEKEASLVDMRGRMERYEKGVFGLKESIRETKQLKLEKSVRDKEIATLTKRINDFEQQASDFLEENEELRSRLGIKTGTKIDLSNVQAIKAVELERAKGLTIALQKEVDSLEQERLKLKEQLRLQALNRGERAVAMGLGVEELTAVEEYAAKLRGSDESPMDVRSAKSARPLLNNVQLEKLTVELERIHVEAAEAREKSDATEKELRRLQAENRALESVVKEVSVTLIKTRGATPAPANYADNERTADTVRFPVIEKLLTILEKKRHKDLSNDLYGNETVEDHIIQVNQSLREELLAVNIRIRELEDQVTSSQKMVENSQRNAETQRLRAMKSRGKALELPTELLLGSVHDYSSVVEQLVECLMELQVKDKELRSVRGSLEKFETHYSELAGKQRHLYRDYHLCKKAATEEVDSLRNQVAEVEIDRDSFKIRAEELEKLLKAIHERTEWNHTQRSLVDSQRNVAVLRVNEITLKRKYLAVADLEQNMRKENARLKTDLMAIDRVARETISRLQISRTDMLAREETLMKALEDSVPKSDNDIQGKVQLAEVHDKMIKLEVAQDVMKKRSELAESKCKSLEENESRLKDRLDSLEASYLETSEANLHLKELQVELQNELEGAIVREEHEQIVKEHKAQKDAISKLNSEVIKYKELAEIASIQTSDLLHLRSQDENVKAILRATIQELQMEGDEKLLIGKLHHHILALQMSESGVIRKLETTQAKCLRLENRVVKLERAVDERDANLFQVKMGSRNSLRLLQKAVSEMRTRIAGQVTLDKHERTCSLVQSLDARKNEFESRINDIEGQKRSLEDTIAEQELELKEFFELIESLKDTSTASDRIVSWQSRMATLQIGNLRLTRDLDFLRQGKLSAEANLEDHMDRVRQLEDQLCALQIESDNKQLEWEKRQEDMENMIQQLEAEREQIFQASSLADLQNALPDRSLPISHQLEASLRMLVERSRLLTAQEIKISGLENKIEKLKDKLASAGDRINQREAHITELRIDVARNDLRQGEGFTEYDNKTRQLVRRREGEAMKSAQEVINSLQRQLAKKDELVERYREIIKDHRKDSFAKEESEQAEIRNLTEIINNLNDRQVNKLRNPPEEEELSALRDKYTLLKQTHKTHLDTSETELHNLRHELSIRNASHHEYESQIETLKRDLHLNEKELAMASEAAHEIQKSRGLQDHISKLNREIQKRDAKIGNMKEAIEQLKETLIKTAENVAEARIRESNEKMTKAIEQYKKSEKALNDSILKMTFDLDKKERLTEKLQDQYKDAQKSLRKAVNESRGGKDSHSRAGSSRHEGGDDHGHDKEKRFAKLLEEEKKRAADAAKERWEVEKKLQKKADVMKAKLNEKTAELNEVVSREKSLKDSIARLQSENSKLQKKLQTLSGLPAAAVAALEAQQQVHRQLQKVQRELFESQDSCDHWKRVAEVEMLKEVKELKRSNKRLEAELEEIENEGGSSNRTSRTTDADDENSSDDRDSSVEEKKHERPAKLGEGYDRNARKGEKSAHVVPMLESRIKDLLQRIQDIEDKKFNVEQALVEVKFDKEKAIVEAERMERRAIDMEEALKAQAELAAARHAKRESNEIPGLNITYTQLRASTGRLLANKSKDELAIVIDHLSSAAEKLKMENEQFKKGSGGSISNVKYMEMCKEIKVLRKEKAEAIEVAKAKAVSDAQAHK
ncbi:hypothetical protein HDU98_010253 [Podochytrium sp. JEL0797]|nr:hypothetical protein HDU98_010235 [Podochytrium sp. JEL0797]KAJ3076977.1 hypothetical protein HDU98_010253 [Podochytrium sp. JEL0797]